MGLTDVPERGRRLHLEVAVDGAGSHPAAWRYPGARPSELFSAAYYVGLAQNTERAGFDFLIIDDSFTLQSDRPQDARGRFDALQLAARIAPTTTRVGIVATVTVTHTEPFHVSTGLATLDFISIGRAGWQIKVSNSDAAARLFGRKGVAPPDEMYAEALEAAEVVTGLWAPGRTTPRSATRSPAASSTTGSVITWTSKDTSSRCGGRRSRHGLRRDGSSW